MTISDEIDATYGYALNDNEINNPQYYRGNNMECIDVIEAFDLDFCRGNAIKYIIRAERKIDRKTDIHKAIWYLNRYLQHCLKEETDD